MMNIKVDRDQLLSELFYLQGVAGAKQMIPTLSHILIETAPGKITMRASDLDVTVTTECEAGVHEGGSICLPARKLAEIVKSLA
jgi:DNA polymerase III subunit beta